VLSLRSFHLVFLLIVMVSADVFGVWCILDYQDTGNLWMLLLGLVSLVGGLGLIVYSFWLVRKLDRAHIA
jgi:LPXTG-motif cell wall-anchored protein